MDSSSFIAYLTGATGPDVEAVAVALEHAQAVLPPVVLTELLSDPKVSMSVKDLFLQLPVLETTQGYWHRAGLLRARLLARGRRARLADSLIAQSCLDHDLSLVTRDSDFRHFVRLAGIRIVPER
ncbi:MAG: type II toxin-antitoxin system VapC family toxin [Candidatus Rokuibacteriota bacterium]